MSLVPKKEFFTSQDLVDGLCTMDQVGLPVVAPPIAPPPDSENYTDWLAGAFQGMGGKAGFIAYAKANSNAVWPLLIKNGLAAFLKEDVKPKTIYDLSDEDILNMDTLELKKIFLASKDIDPPPGHEPRCPHCNGVLKST